MNARTTALTLTGPAPRRRAPRVITPQAIALQQLATTWNSLSGTDKSTWELLAQQNADPARNGAPPRAGAYNAFIGHNASLYAASLPTLTVAPPQQDAPPLPGLTLSATFGPVLTLTLTADTPYPHRLLLYGARPRLAPRAIYQKTPFNLLGALPALATAADITALYQTRFRIPSPGYRIALRVVGVSANGFRTPPQSITAVVGATLTLSQTPPVGQL